MIVFNRKSWHYRVILYVFGEGFFREEDGIDHDATDRAFRKHGPHFRYLKFKYKDRQMNLCPYCRAIVAACLAFPFVFVLNHIPWWYKLRHREPKPFDIEKSRRNSKILRCTLGIAMFGFATMHFLNGEWFWGAFQVGIGLFNIFSPQFLKWCGEKMLPVFKRYWAWKDKRDAKRKPKPKKDHKTVSLIRATLESEHDKICPPIHFVDELDEDKLK